MIETKKIGVSDILPDLIPGIANPGVQVIIDKAISMYGHTAVCKALGESINWQVRFYDTECARAANLIAMAKQILDRLEKADAIETDKILAAAKARSRATQ